MIKKEIIIKDIEHFEIVTSQSGGSGFVDMWDYKTNPMRRIAKDQYTIKMGDHCLYFKYEIKTEYVFMGNTINFVKRKIQQFKMWLRDKICGCEYDD